MYVLILSSPSNPVPLEDISLQFVYIFASSNFVFRLKRFKSIFIMERPQKMPKVAKVSHQSQQISYWTTNSHNDLCGVNSSNSNLHEKYFAKIPDFSFKSHAL